MKKTLIVCLSLSAVVLWGKPRITLSHQTPCNMFDVGKPVTFTASLSDLPPGEGKLSIKVVDYAGAMVFQKELPFKQDANRRASMPIDLGITGSGYYELTASFADATPVTCSFGVAQFFNRTAPQARDGGYRFGLKVFQIGAPGVWWNRSIKWDVKEATDACAALGLNWTRHGINQAENKEEPGIISTADVLKRDMNLVAKIEGIPPEAYDEKRYGPMEEYNKKNKRGWQRTTVPLKAPYQAWLREQVKQMPKDQVVFEIGNEVWDYMSAEEYAEWCNLVVPVIREVYPKAEIAVDPGKLEWAKRFAAAGGFKGTTAQVLHPYCFSVQPEVRARNWIRNRQEAMSLLAGHKLDTHITEYGWSTAPRDTKRKHGVSERVQAQRTVRESLMLYAEGCKTLIPHWMADREQDETEREHWFGFFRLKGEPKPVLLAHVTCARMIDGGEFLGDLWLGEDIGAMMFRKNGRNVLALWTIDTLPEKTIKLDVKAPGIEQVDIMGRTQPLVSSSGSLKVEVKVSGDVTYLVGVGDAMRSALIPPSADIRTDRWTRRAPLQKLVVNAETPIRLQDKNGVVAPDALSVVWGEDKLRVIFRASTNAVLTGALSTWPGRQLDLGDGTIYDYTLTIDLAPKSGGEPVFKCGNPMFKEPLACGLGKVEKGVRFNVAPEDNRQVYTADIPWSLLGGKPKQSALYFKWSSNGRYAASAILPSNTSQSWPLVDLQDKR